MDPNKELFINIDFDIDRDIFCFNTNIKSKRIADIITDFLRGQKGKGVDNSKAEIHELYTIDVALDLTKDTFYSRDDCGNKGLREGILLHFLNKLADSEEGK